MVALIPVAAPRPVTAVGRGVVVRVRAVQLGHLLRPLDGHALLEEDHKALEAFCCLRDLAPCVDGCNVCALLLLLLLLDQLCSPSAPARGLQPPILLLAGGRRLGVIHQALVYLVALCKDPVEVLLEPRGCGAHWHGDGWCSWCVIQVQPLLEARAVLHESTLILLLHTKSI